MSGSFSIGALAVARPEANAVGAVRLTLMPKRLEIELLSAARHREGFVPGALTRLARIAVPYTAVRGFVRQGGGLLLTLEPRAVTPYNRFFLTHFTDLPLEALASAHRRSRRAGWLSWALPIPLALLLTKAAPTAWASGPLGLGSLLLLLLIAFGFGFSRLAQAFATGGPLSASFADAFEYRLAQRVGVIPQASHETDPFEVPELVRQRPAAPWARPLVARPRLPLRALGMSLAGAAAIVLVSFGLREAQKVVPSVQPEARAGLGTEQLPETPRLLTSKYEPCSCERADSPLWRGGLPVLSVLPIGKQDAASLGDISPKVSENGASRYDFDMAVVNNAAAALRDVRVLLTFARRNGRGERVGVTDRGLFWEGDLAAGRSVKWGVRAPGSEVRIDIDEKRLLGSANAPATAEQFRKLLVARQPLVRLHAVVMLAYLGDPGAAEAARSIGPLPELDERVRQQVLRALEPTRVCDVRPEADGLRACLYNGTDSSLVSPQLAEVIPEGQLGRSRVVDEAIGKKSGIVVSFPDFGDKPEELALRSAAAK